MESVVCKSPTTDQNLVELKDNSTKLKSIKGCEILKWHGLQVLC